MSLCVDKQNVIFKYTTVGNAQGAKTLTQNFREKTGLLFLWTTSPATPDWHRLC